MICFTLAMAPLETAALEQTVHQEITTPVDTFGAVTYVY